MRLSFMTFACPQWDLPDVLAAAARYGYDGIEPRLDSQHAHGLEVDLSARGRAQARAAAAAAKVELCCLATSLTVIKLDATGRAALLADTEARVRLAADLGIPGLRVFAGGIPPHVDRDEALAAGAANLRALGDVAAAAGVELWLETHDTVSAAKLAGAMINAADHPAVHANYDILHPLRMGEAVADSFAALAGHIRHTHWHDAKVTGADAEITRLGEGDVPLAEIVRRLRAVGYTGYLSGEWFEQQMGLDPPGSLRHFGEATRALLQE